MKSKGFVRGHIHIPVGIALLLALALPIVAAEIERAPLMLLSAQTHDHHWKSNLRVDALPSQIVKQFIHITQASINCSSIPIELVPGGSFYTYDFADTYFCAPAEFELFTVPGADAFTVWYFNDAVSQSSFKLGPIGAVEIGQPSYIPEAASIFGDITTVNAVGSGVLKVDFYGNLNTLISSETLLVDGPTQKRLTTIGYGHLVISMPDCRCGPYVPAPVYGFVTVGTPFAGNLRIYPFGVATDANGL